MRLFQALFVGLVIVGLSIFLISCGTNDANYRVVHTIAAIANQYSIDIDVNDASPVITSSTWADVAFTNVEPAGSYQKIAAGSDPIEVFQTGTLTPVINSTPMNLGQNYYTVILLGAGPTQPPITSPAALVLSDNNNTPTQGNGEFRIINATASVSNSGGLDIYLLPSGTVFPNQGIQPDVSALGYGQPSIYVSKTGSSGGTGGGYQLYVTPHGSQISYIRGYSLPTLAVGQIYSIVLVDFPGGGYIDAQPIILTDLR
jgi:hypothetical protein